MELGILSYIADTGTCYEERISAFGLTAIALSKVYTVEALLTNTLVNGQAYFNRLHNIPFELPYKLCI